MDPAELTSRLRPPRLPDDFLAVAPQDFIAGFGLGLLLAVLISVPIRRVLRRTEPSRANLRERLARLLTLPTPLRLLRQAEILHEQGRALEQGEREALYRPGLTVDHARIDARILGQARGR